VEAAKKFLKENPQVVKKIKEAALSAELS